MNNSSTVNTAYGKANTFYLKAKDDLLKDAQLDQLTYQNKLQFEVTR